MKDTKAIIKDVASIILIAAACIISFSGVGLISLGGLLPALSGVRIRDVITLVILVYLLVSRIVRVRKRE